MTSRAAGLVSLVVLLADSRSDEVVVDGRHGRERQLGRGDVVPARLGPQLPGQVSVGGLREGLVAPVDQVGPDDGLLGEAEHSEASPLQRRVVHVAGVGDQLVPFEDAQAHESQGGSVQQEPAVGHFLLPAHVAGVTPQQAHLAVRVSRVPERVAERLPWPGVRVDELELDAGLRDGPERRGLPVRLTALLPHDGVEAAVVLVAEHEAHVVVVHFGVHEEGTFEIDSPELLVSDRESGV
uniref:Putative secreted protein n=1 Tax=Ixodes ricinus TaxID=34613 RepID=A0A6B0V6Q7_IXORI